MTKTVKRSFILTLAMLLMLSLAALFTGFLKASAAEATEPQSELHEIDESNLPDDLRPLAKNDGDLAGKYIFFSTDDIGEGLYIIIGTEDYQISPTQFKAFGVSLNYTTPIEAGKTYYYRLPDISGTATQITENSSQVDSTIKVRVSDSFNGVINEPEDPDDGGNIGEWLDNAGTAVSDWLKSNTGIAVSSTGVILIALVIIVLFIGKRK